MCKFSKKTYNSFLFWLIHDKLSCLRKWIFFLFFACCTLLTAYWSYAQITIDSNNFPVAGLSVTRYYALTDDILDSMGGPGADQNYDFSKVFIIPEFWLPTGMTNPDTINYLDPFITPFADDHPGASVALYSPGDGGDQYHYYSTYGNNYWKSGLTQRVDFGQGMDTIHANHLPGDEDTILSNLYIYGHSETESSLITLSFLINTIPVDVKSYTIKDIVVDGWGTLDTPFNFFDDVLRIKYVQYQFDSIFVYGNYNSDTAYPPVYYYHYYAENIRHPVVIVHTDMFDTIQLMEIISTPPIIYGCMDTAAINYNPIANENDGSCIYCNPISFTISADAEICNGETAILSVTGGNSYLWSTGDTTASIAVSPDSTKMYSVYINENTYCWELATIVITVHNDVQAGFWVNTSNLTISDSVLFVNLSNRATDYYWDFGDYATSTEENPRHLYSSAGTKNVMLIASNPCSADTFNSSIFVATGTGELLVAGCRLQVYPNPGSENTTISFHLEKASVVELNIFDVFGRSSTIIDKKVMSGGDHSFNLNSFCNDLTAGLYVIQLSVIFKRDTVQNLATHQYRQKWIKL
ncbi:MAG: PKD domain-containing protein [Bacteroidota bacterium]